MSDDWYKEIPLKAKTKKEAWEKIQGLYWKYYSKLPGKEYHWIFRGEKKFKKQEEHLCTSLERAFKNYGIRNNNDKVTYERIIIREFQRKASLYIEGGEPDKDDILEWFSLMRHHGAPVRLMDWNYSFYIAVYFALAENTDGGVVWAINAAKINKTKKVKEKIKRMGKGSKLNTLRTKLKERMNDILEIRSIGDKLEDLAITCYLMKNPLPLVYPVNPFRLNKRLTIQHGVFVLIGDIRRSFQKNLKACYKDKNDIHKITIECDNEKRKEILRHLKNMNISNEVLFPGLDGFAKSTGELLAYPEAITTKTK